MIQRGQTCKFTNNYNITRHPRIFSKLRVLIKMSEIIWASWKSHPGHPVYWICLNMHLTFTSASCQSYPVLSRQGFTAFREMCSSWGWRYEGYNAYHDSGMLCRITQWEETKHGTTEIRQHTRFFLINDTTILSNTL